MPRIVPIRPVQLGFEKTGVRLAIADIAPLRLVTTAVKKTPKYRQIAASIREVGIVEPPIVARDRREPGKYLLLDGHLRIEALKEMAETEVVCLLSTDDEAFTYNKRVNRLAIVQEHKMILKTVESGVPEERLAKALNVNIASIRRKRRLLDGICSEAAELLKEKHLPIQAFWILKKMMPLRQIEAANLMVAMNRYTMAYAKLLLAGTPPEHLVEAHRPKVIKGLTDEQVALMERESENLQQEFKLAEQSYGVDHLDLVLAKGYLGSLLGNARVARYLAQHHGEILREFQKIAEMEQTAA